MKMSVSTICDKAAAMKPRRAAKRPVAAVSLAKIQMLSGTEMP